MSGYHSKSYKTHSKKKLRAFITMGVSVHIFLGIALTLLIAGYVPATKGALTRGLGEPYIINGVNTDIEKVPYQISMELFRAHTCGGVIISEKHVLTAGHCVGGPLSYLIWAMRLRAGSTIQVPFFNLFGGVIHQIQSVKPHPSFSLFTLDYDVAVITVSNTFAYGPRINSIAIPTEGEDFIDFNQKATISGWGLTKIGGLFPPFHLQSAEVPLIPRVTCQERVSSKAVISERMLCGAGTGKNDTNSGDSGGPVTHKGKLIGLVSWGLRRIDPTLPSGYSNLLNVEMRSFIKTETGV